MTWNRVKAMIFIKNFFIFAISVVIASLVIIVFDKMGMNKNFNLFFSSFLYSVFIILYFKNVITSLLCFFTFYSMLFLLSHSLEVVMMLITSLSTLLLIEVLMPKLKKDVVIPIYKTDSFWVLLLFIKNYYLKKFQY
jgi:hypothetical protein